MAIAEHVLVEKGFAFVATRGSLSDVSISFYGDDPHAHCSHGCPHFELKGS